MTVEVRLSAIASSPDAQGVVTKHNWSAIDRNFRQIVEPGDFRPDLYMTLLASIALAILGKGKPRFVVLGWAGATVFALAMTFILEMD
jgi:hypothetical protein